MSQCGKIRWLNDNSLLLFCILLSAAVISLLLDLMQCLGHVHENYCSRQFVWRSACYGACFIEKEKRGRCECKQNRSSRPADELKIVLQFASIRGSSSDRRLLGNLMLEKHVGGHILQNCTVVD